MTTSSTLIDTTTSTSGDNSQKVLAILFWAYVSIPLAWGIFQTLKKAMALFS
ncbi:hypothetical protein LX59_00823 [Azomonas agilis]|uniref:Oxalate:formate antiporter n=1 Tax=Azomonas agilis TaxID=116849 RepID=A0A562J0Q8_9GAMM|nr:oxalate:formate antiporter [Azomonas agilis]TWH76778.1 hypothetical protein LX59_00823 [Azomonas agilis]